MREEQVKLEHVKKSCNITAIVSKVLEGIMIAATVLCLVSGICVLCMNKQIDQGIEQTIAQEEGTEIKESFEALGNVQVGGLVGVSAATSEMIKEGQYSLAIAVYCLMGTIICAAAALVFDMLRRVFKVIKTAETPFAAEVLRKIKVLFIIICVEILLINGVGGALLSALIFWSIYNILDYGFVLQKEVDETL